MPGSEPTIPASLSPSGWPDAVPACRPGPHQTAAPARCCRIVILLAGIWIFNAFDLILTLHAHANELLQEGNPIARLMLSRGPLAVLLFKIGPLAAASVILYRYRDCWCSSLASAVVLCAYAGLSIHWKLCYEMYDITLSTGVTPAELTRLTAWTPCIPFL